MRQAYDFDFALPRRNRPGGPANPAFMLARQRKAVDHARMPACSKGTIACSRNWGTRQSLVIVTITGSALRQRKSLGLKGDGVRMELIGGDENSVDVAIEVAADASLGPRMLIIEYALACLMIPDFFTIVEPTGMSSAGLEMRGIGSHLL